MEKKIIEKCTKQRETLLEQTHITWLFVYAGEVMVYQVKDMQIHLLSILANSCIDRGVIQLFKDQIKLYRRSGV